MKAISKILVVTIGLLVMPMAKAAPSCETIWGGGTASQIEAIDKFLVVGDGTQYPSYRVGLLLREHALKYCAERFSFMATNKDPFGFLGWVLRNNGYLKNGVSVPETLPAEWLKGIIAGPGFGLFLPTSPGAKVSGGEIVSLADVYAELKAFKTELESDRDQSMSDEDLNEIVERLSKLGRLTPEGVVPEAVVKSLEDLATTLKEGFKTYLKGEFTDEMKSLISQQAEVQQAEINSLRSDIDDLKAAGEVRDVRLNDLEAADKDLIDTNDHQWSAIHDLSDRLFGTEGDIRQLGYSNYALAAAIFLTLLLLWGLVRRLEKVEDHVISARRDMIQTLLDVERLDREVVKLDDGITVVENVLNGDDTKEHPGLVEQVASHERRLVNTIKVANKAKKDLAEHLVATEGVA